MSPGERGRLPAWRAVGGEQRFLASSGVLRRSPAARESMCNPRIRRRAQQFGEVGNRVPQLRTQLLQQTLAGERISPSQKIGHHGGGSEPNRIPACLNVAVASLKGRPKDALDQILFAQHRATPVWRTLADSKRNTGSQQVPSAF